MEPPSLSKLLENGDVATNSNGLVMEVDQEWIVPSETRLSYTVIIQLVECCRELHWKNDVAPVGDKSRIDSITKTINADFNEVISVGAQIKIEYSVREVGNRSYSLLFRVIDVPDDTLHAEIEMVSVFYDSDKSSSIEPSEKIVENLRKLKEN